MPEVPKIDEFSFVLLASVLFIFIMAFAWTTPTESPPVVVQTSFHLSASPGEKTSFDFTISGKPRLTALNLTATGKISNWVTFNKNNFDIYDSDKVTVTIKVPGNTTEGLYTGRVIIAGSGGRDSFSINIDVTGDRRELESRLISEDEFLSDFTVSYYEGTDTIDSKTDKVVSKGYFSTRALTLAGLLTEEKLSITTGGNIRLVIEDTNSLGNLIVEFNDEQIYKRKPGVGEIVIPIDKEKIEMSNVVKVKTTSPGIMFWTSANYDIKTVELNIDYKGAFAKDFNITLSKNEVDNFRRFNLFYRVKGYTAPLPEMMIKVNNQIVYWQTPPLVIFDERISEDMFGNPLYLNEGTNRLIFMFEENAVYTIGEALLTVEYYE